MTLAVLPTPECPHSRDIRCSRNFSTAPLSRIPGRLSSLPSSRRISNLVAPLIDPLPSGVTSICASPRDIPSVPRQSTPIILSCQSSESHTRASPASVVAPSMYAPLLPRKKSGELLKSSLKVRRTRSRGPITLITDPVNSSSSKNTPAMPAHKGVRFHSQLEHVKLFLAKQKPLAISRDGNPTDTSGTDSEIPPFIYPRDDGLKDRPFIMLRIDVPTVPPLAEDTRDVAVDNIDLVGTTVEGTVRVRNIAFEKRVAVRFTLDKWQTTSEITAHYKESLPNGAFDRFMFSIKLADALSRAEEKTLYLAVRCSVAGREVWDNNSGRDYQVRFVRENALGANKEAVVESREESSRADDIVDLRLKLEELVKLGCPSKTVSSILAHESRRRCESPSPTRSPPLRDATPSFRSECSLAARYDFATSACTPWCPPAAHQTPSLARTLAPLRGRTRCRGRSLRPCTPLVVSPATADVSSCFPDSDDAITLVPSLHCRSRSGSRNHTRGGTIMLSHAPGVKRTPPTSPSGSLVFPPFPPSTPTPPLPQTQPYACPDSSLPHSSPKLQLQTQDTCEEGISSMTSSSSYRSPSPSPNLSPAEPASPTPLMPPGPDTDKESDSPTHHVHYHNIVNRYCFYTGSGPGGVLGHSDFIPRSLSTSSVEEFLSNPYSSNPLFPTLRLQRGERETASDDELQRRRRRWRSPTPTGPVMRFLPHTPTPTNLLF